MKSNALLINTARGALVNENDLLRALSERRIAGAGIDVLRQEPPPAGNVLLEADLDNLIITPHVAWSSREAMQSLADQVVENIEAFVDGHVVNRIV
jgi:glycerate dehydrogenase